ncbi:hypothetical protein GALMADRAFT_133512 [Galerina marginata CBS 339.88]|uniref:Hydrophobin n=1 Tax=Galerina marginata (strain CBS 339.88) TaxID=685588 RepID=A0A067TLW0_GALM3|nr:hypothetical protein GALMADRAFT_133512 [Galerina marginata CBS 339.88]
MRAIGTVAFLAIAFPILAAADFCNTGSILCCSSLVPSSSQTAFALSEILGLPPPLGGGFVGLSCTPLSVIGVGTGCSGQLACCTGNNFQGVMAFGSQHEILIAITATVAFAAPSEDNKAVANDGSSSLKYLLTNSPAGHQASEDGPAPPDCYWDGTAPFCVGFCPTGYYEENRGYCGDGACCWTGIKSLCCRNVEEK